ncbi:hypothetical protein L2E82_28157 [Cichorium intybus]|uniref:Uncharacterized protein n=1 Tax=Cichorium intybus TaxID=13427 RepID=A0ACB9CVE7_CICIN|nr:hypothetical protein L2E82_28157 [Cichorium intybus]
MASGNVNPRVRLNNVVLVHGQCQPWKAPKWSFSIPSPNFNSANLANPKSQNVKQRSKSDFQIGLEKVHVGKINSVVAIFCRKIECDSQRRTPVIDFRSEAENPPSSRHSTASDSQRYSD